MILELFTKVYEIVARWFLMTFDHDMTLTKHFNIFKEIVVEIINFMIYGLLEEVDEFIRISHDFWLSFLVLLDTWSLETTTFAITVIVLEYLIDDLFKEPWIDGIT